MTHRFFIYNSARDRLKAYTSARDRLKAPRTLKQQ
jgi:hypothetical protein